MADDKIEDANAKLDLSSPVDATKPPAVAVSQSQDLAIQDAIEEAKDAEPAVAEQQEDADILQFSKPPKSDVTNVVI